MAANPSCKCELKSLVLYYSINEIIILMKSTKLLRNVTSCVSLGILSIFFSFQAMAQSTVVFMMKSLPISGTISVNGDQPFELKGEVKKVTKATGPMIYDLVEYTDVCRKCVIKEEGKVLFAYEGIYQNIVNGDIVKYASEIQIDLEDGETYYVSVERHGLNDQKLELIPEKKALKFMNKKGCAMLPDVIIESL